MEKKLHLEKTAIINIRAEQEIANAELNKVLVKLEDARARRNEVSLFRTSYGLIATLKTFKFVICYCISIKCSSFIIIKIEL